MVYNECPTVTNVKSLALSAMWSLRGVQCLQDAIVLPCFPCKGLFGYKG